MSSSYDVDIFLEVEDEDSIEVMDWKVPCPDMETFKIVMGELGELLDEMDGSEILDKDPETGIIIPLEEGVYKFSVTIDVENETFTVNEKSKLTDEEAEKCYSELELPEANF